MYLDKHSGTCGDGDGDRYLWWKSLETMMTSDGVVRAAQLSPGTWAFSASDDSLKGLISALLIPPHSSFHKHATCMESMHMIMSLQHNAWLGWWRSQSDLLTHNKGYEKTKDCITAVVEENCEGWRQRVRAPDCEGLRC